MKLTMYELLRMVKDGKAPKRIKVTGNVYEYDDEFGMYMCDQKTYKVALGGMENEINLICNAFNEIVEILDDEEKKIPEETTISEEQVLFNKLSYENQQFILKLMRFLQPCEVICEIDEEKGLPEKINDWISTVGSVDDSNIEEYIYTYFI